METKSTNTSEKHQSQQLNPSANRVLILGGRLGLEAVEDKIIIQLDKYKSGYECSTCKGEGRLTHCPCETQGTPGFNERGRTCKYCEGNADTRLSISRYGKECPDCKGHGSTIIIPEAAKALPTSGVIVSAGPNCKLRKEGERVLFGAHVGYFLPFKGSVKIRCMRENEILCLLYSVDSINLGDHIADNEL